MTAERKIAIIYLKFNPLSANPTKWSNTRGWRLKS